MKTLKAITGALLACMALGIQAAPVIFSSSQFETTAVAVAGAVADVDTKSSPPDALPLISPAVAVSGTNFASALGLADFGLLVAQAEASSTGELASSVATAYFEGTFSTSRSGHMKFWIDFLDLDFTDAGQFSDAALFLTLTFEGTTYADLVLTGADDPYFLQVNLPGAGTGMLSLLLASEAVALDGDAANFAQVQFRMEMPEPGTLALVLAAGLIGGVTTRPRRDAQSAAPALA